MIDLGDNGRLMTYDGCASGVVREPTGLTTRYPDIDNCDKQEPNAMAGQNLLELTDANFESEVIQSDTPVLVDFWAEWCQPCKMLGPTIEKIANEYEGKVKVGKVDTDSNRETAVKFNITAIPTVIIFDKGTVAQQVVGLKGEVDYKKILDGLIG